MIALGIGELVSSSTLILRHVFGDEEGISVDRTRVLHLLGITFGPQEQVYYLIAVWCFASVAAMYAITRTPFGRIPSNAKDGPPANKASHAASRACSIQTTCQSFNPSYPRCRGISWEMSMAGRDGRSRWRR
jgi:hypothetical protein